MGVTGAQPGPVGEGAWTSSSNLFVNRRGMEGLSPHRTCSTSNASLEAASNRRASSAARRTRPQCVVPAKAF